MVIPLILLNLHPQFKCRIIMAVTRLKRKDRRNKARASNRVKRIKQLSRKPVIKNLDDSPEAAGAKTEAPVVAAAPEAATSEEEE